MSQLFVISAPSGSGKTSLLKALIERFGKKLTIKQIVTYTTRPPRPHEIEGIDYHFITPELFEHKKATNFFIETVVYNNYYYGTSRESLLAHDQVHYFAILTRHGARAIKKYNPHSILVWIYPPNIEELERRLIGRATDNHEDITRRLALAHKELREEESSPCYDYHIKNSVFEVALQELVAIVIAHKK